MLLEEMLARIPGVELTGDPCVDIRGISHDSRAVGKGFLFVAIKGERTDGMRFLGEAIERGASAFACEDLPPPGPAIPALRVADARRFLAEAARVFYEDPTAELKLVAITGTNGKTTTSYLLDSIFRQAGLQACVVGTIGSRISGASFPALHTTPEASDLMAFLRRAATEGCTHGALEVSSHGLVLKRVYGARFAAAVFTNLTQDHLDFHQDMESYYQAKRLLFVPAGGNRVEASVINTDDTYGRRLVEDAARPVLTFGWQAGADVHVLSHESRADGTGLSLASPEGDLRIQSRLVGRPNVYNIMAATGAALCLGIGRESIRKGIEALKGVPGRMELVDAGQPFTVIVDYAHTPDALRNLLDTAALLPHSNLITVFGCGGDRDKSKRAAMGRIAGRMSGLVVATSDNPRSEDPLAILGEIESGLKEASACYTVIPDRRAAIEYALSAARKGDVVLIAGKGHETRQVIGARTLPFDDRAVARELILRSADANGARN